MFRGKFRREFEISSRAISHGHFAKNLDMDEKSFLHQFNIFLPMIKLDEAAAQYSGPILMPFQSRFSYQISIARAPFSLSPMLGLCSAINASGSGRVRGRTTRKNRGLDSMNKFFWCPDNNSIKTWNIIA